ncbi:SIR2 family protein [Chromobacterium amazonense]|uniref:SIR2 family protein n=1 Tax=Chromobacterium amazonense TaxID=1382803 RepID=UPI0031F6309D
MPDFIKLTKHVIDFFDPPFDSEIMAAFRPWLDDQSAANVPLDQIFNLLHQEYGKDEVNALVTGRLTVSMDGQILGREHSLIKRISASQSGVPQIVTTNFDRLFEAGSNANNLSLHVPPAFPNLNFGSTIEGITYLHGRLVEIGAKSHPYVLSSADFGRAYLSEGWATNFIRHLLERYTVVLVGYRAEDPPVKYLLQGLNNDGKYDRSKLYAFDRGNHEEIEAKWRDRGVTAIAYAEHDDLWTCMEAWADRADNPRKWRASIIVKSQQDPKSLSPHERGQVAHVLRTAQGARLFSEADPAPHPEWLCVMDANVRSAEQSRDYGEDAEIFDPFAAYGLDDDLCNISDWDRKRGVRNDDLLAWRSGDDNLHESHRLGGRQAEGFEAMPKRLAHLATWISKSIDSPVLAWWTVRQNGLHPRLLQLIKWQIEHSDALSKRARQIWGLILEHHRDPRNRQQNREWFDLKRRIDSEGWTIGVLREFSRVATPRINIIPPSGLGRSKPPSSTWEAVPLREFGQFEIKLLERYNEDMEVPDEILPKIFSTLQEQLIIASGLLADIEPVYMRTPSCYPNRQVDGKQHLPEDAATIVWFIQLFDQMAAKWPKLAHAHASTWPAADPFFFRKLKLYAFSKATAFQADHVAKEVLSLDQQAFWDNDVVRELLFLLEDRWKEFPLESRNRLVERILAGPDQLSYWPDEEFPQLQSELAARYARYLELQGCELMPEHHARLAKIISDIPGWRDSWASSIVIAQGSHVGWVGTDENPEAISNLPDNKVIPKAKEDWSYDFASFTEKRSFTGLVKTKPRKALAALTIAGKAGDYPKTFWTAMLNELPIDVSPRLRRVLLHRVARLPHAVIAELRHSLSEWLKKNLVALIDFDDHLAWVVYDHIIDGILDGGGDATTSSLGEVKQSGKVIQRSRRIYAHAINGPIGKCTEALFQVMISEKLAADAGIPDYIKSRIERLFTLPGEGADHAVSISANRLSWLLWIDPIWAKKRLIPMLAFEHPAAEPAWNGFLHSGHLSWPLAEIIKPLLLKLFPWIEGLSWDRDLAAVATK